MKQGQTQKQKKSFLIIAVIALAVIAIAATGIFLWNNPSKDEEISYTVLGDNDLYDSNYAERGYYVEKSDGGKAKVTIASGERNNGGYGIGVEKVVTQNGVTKIYVKESAPEPDSIVTMALTYPKVIVLLNKLPKKIEVVGQDGVAFKELNK